MIKDLYKDSEKDCNPWKNAKRQRYLLKSKKDLY